MNERIKELLNEATSGHEQDLSLQRTVTADEMVKFAEMIVKECLGMIENEASTYAEPVWAFELVNDIKEHFGVEE